MIVFPRKPEADERWEADNFLMRQYGNHVICAGDKVGNMMFNKIFNIIYSPYKV